VYGLTAIIIMEDLTFEQLSEKDKAYVLREQEKYKSGIPIHIKILLARIEFLKSIGFVENEHFRYKCNKETYMRNACFPSENGGGYYKYELEGIDTTISLINPTFDSSTGNIRTFESVCYFDDKKYISCSRVMDRRGYYKPSTILDKIKFLWEVAENCKKAHVKKYALIQDVINKFQSRYPLAEITSQKNIKHRQNMFNANADVLTIKFPSGSYIELVVDDTRSLESCVIARFDAETDGLPVTQMLDKFNQQVPCGVEETA
jgi:hypothetical protein